MDDQEYEAWCDDLWDEWDENSNTMMNHDSLAQESGFEEFVALKSAHSKRSREIKAHSYY